MVNTSYISDVGMLRYQPGADECCEHRRGKHTHPAGWWLRWAITVDGVAISAMATIHGGCTIGTRDYRSEVGGHRCNPSLRGSLQKATTIVLGFGRSYHGVTSIGYYRTRSPVGVISNTATAMLGIVSSTEPRFTADDWLLALGMWVCNTCPYHTPDMRYPGCRYPHRLVTSPPRAWLFANLGIAAQPAGRRSYFFGDA